MQESSVRGIRVERDAKDKQFVKFFEIVQAEAKKNGCVFFVDTGEGHELITDEFDGEDLSGWLVDEKEADSFESHWIKGDSFIDKKFDERMRIARWEKDNEYIKISFIDW